MKKLMFLFLLTIAVISCSVDGEVVPSEILLPVDNVEMSHSYTVDSTSTMIVKYRRPTDCYFFNGFNITAVENVLEIGIRAVIFNHNNCLADNETLYEVPLEWKPTTPGQYTFKFWIGNDGSGEPLFIEHNILVE